MLIAMIILARNYKHFDEPINNKIIKLFKK